jgi:acyl dehydratase
MQDTAENAIRELRMDKIRLKAPVFHGDTLYAYSKVLSKQDSDTYPLTSGIVHFEHYGVNQNNLIVFQAERWVLVKKRLT